MKDQVVFPILELTGWVFDDEKVFFAETDWDPVHTVMENELEKHYSRTLVDSAGNILNVALGKIVKGPRTKFSPMFQSAIVVELDLRRTGQTISIDDLKRLVLARKDELFQITTNKLMTVNDFIKKVNGTTEFKELIAIASFGLD